MIIALESKQLLIPLFFQVLLTFLLMFRLAYLRFSVIRNGTVKIKDIALGQKAWPEHLVKVDNCFHNQLQLPIIFYCAIILVLVLQKVDTYFLFFASWYVTFRYIHAYIEITSNYVPNRFRAFFLGNMGLIAMWIRLVFCTAELC